MTEQRQAWLDEVGRLRQLQVDGDRTMITERELINAVRMARSLGATWQQIGDASGTTRQYVNKRFKDVI